MPRGKANESNKAKKSSNTKPNTKRGKQTKKKSDAAANKNKSNAGEKVAAGEIKDGRSGAAGPKTKINISKRLLEWLEPEKLELIKGWVRNGLTEKEIAFNMHCSYSTLKEWKKKSSAFSAALKKNREISDAIVEGALFKKAIGHKETIKKPMKVKRTEYDSETGKRLCDYEEIIYVDEEVYIPPDTLGQIFWLKNRRPDIWQDKVEQKIEAEVDNTGGVVMLAPRLEENDV